MSTSSPREPRPVDHLVLPTGDLDAAQSRLERLGFVVAPVGRHPFGTENVCVFLGDDSFLEFLAIGQRETCEAEARSGNVFVARDQAYRFRNGNEGFSALVVGTQDAIGDHDAFVKAGISAGAMLNFSRPFRTPDGKEDTAGFRLAFAADLRAPDAFFFTCERVNTPKVDRTALQTHENGAVALREIVLSEVNPTDFQYPLQDVINQRDVNAHSFGIDLRAANANVTVLTPQGLRSFFGIEASTTERGLRLQAFVLAVRDVAAVETLLSQNNIPFENRGSRLIVHKAPGQGAAIAFEAL
ncbi:lactoylglutathione lyase [Phyllobacterium brassicacearum]|uniref:Lactoylglutathione lyase n=1 Tax=Phyllobacterium brassicacearum TaxID=314235 RepID=A0A2P7BSB1_9HYPH|nr:VOC family protein [Phyllobacterium brassicacearum]PSH69355.1 lactoylglutathione lyase [Phyllobacterium brassicacearum]TDQ34476.1 glyoxalase-like protein [Phyllobacterium brassicacearum]